MTVANRLTLLGLACVGLGMIGALLLVTDMLFAGITVYIAFATLGCAGLWCALPLLRRARPLRGRAPGAAARATRR